MRTENDLKRTLAWLLTLAVLCTWLPGCGDASPENGNAGIPGHRGAASPKSAKTKAARPAPGNKNKSKMR